MENDIQKHKDKLYSQIQDEYGKLVYTYTCHFKIADRLQKRNAWIKWGQIILSAVSTGGFLGVLISNEQILLWADKDIATEKKDHIKAANCLWKVREEYLSLLTDFDTLNAEEIMQRRNQLINRSADIYDTAPITDAKSYVEAQKALKSDEEQFFTPEELNKMLPPHLRK